jgi:AsmA protein
VKRWLLGLAVVLLVLVAGGYFVVRSALASDLARRQLEQQLSARLGQPVRISTMTTKVFPGIAVDLGGVTIGKPEALRFDRIRVFTGIRALFGETIDIRRIDVANGRPDGDARFAFDLAASVFGDRLDVESLVLRGPTTRVDAKGALTSITNVQGEFDAESRAMDLSELIAIAAVLSPKAAGPSAKNASPLHLVLRLKASTVRFDQDQLRDLSTTIDVVPSRVALNNLSASLFGGTFTGKLEADTRTPTPVLRLTGALAGLDVAELLKRTGSAGGVTGRLTGRLSLVGEGVDGASLTRSARGTIDATVSNGTLPHLDVVRRVVLAFGKPSGETPGGPGTAFDTLGGTFALAGGALRSENLALRSRDVDTDGRGTLVVGSGAIDARADVTLSKELTSQAGTDLRRYAQQDGRVVVPATLNGTLAEPSISIDVVAAARRALGNELQRRIGDFIGGLFKKKKGGD